MPRPYRVLHGVGYPHLIKGCNPTNVIEANLNDRKGVYYDNAVRLSETDLSNFGTIVGKPLRLEHQEQDVGQITRAWVDAEGQLRINAHLYVDTPLGRDIDRRLQEGTLRGLSVGYESHVDTSRGLAEITHKTFHEISICEQGFFPGANISVFASNQESNSDAYKSLTSLTASPVIPFNIMATEQVNTPNPTPEVQEPAKAPAPTAPVPVNEDTAKASRELLTQMDVSVTEAEQLKAKLAELEKQKAAERAELEQLREEKRLREEARRREQIQQAEVTITAMKESLGTDLPEQFAAGVKSVWVDPALNESRQMFEVLAAKLKESQQRVSEMEELKRKVTEMEETQKKATQFAQRTQASIMGLREGMTELDADKARAAHEESQMKIEVGASRGANGLTPQGFASVFKVPAPSPSELQLVRDSVPGMSVGVSASDLGAKYAGREVRAKPRHEYEQYCPGSLANYKETAPMWHWAMTQDTTGLQHMVKFDKQYNTMETKKAGDMANMTWYKTQ